MRKNEFTDLVLSWSPKLEILDDNLYKNKLVMIPETFESVDRYLGSFAFPLLEETRAELAAAMQEVFRAPFVEITSLRKSSGFYVATADSWKNGTSDRVRQPYRILPGDVFLLSDLKPQPDFDIQRAGPVCKIACVMNNTSDDESENICTSSGFKLKMAEQIETTTKSFYAVYLMNLASKRRMWNALRMRQNMTIIEKVLNKNDLGKGNCELCPLKCNSGMEEKSALFSKLNASQLEAVVASLRNVECDHRSSVELIWGPPGTGKTTTLSILLYILLKMKTRTIICAPTNVAITELASQVITLVKSSVEPESCSLGDMLMYGNKDDLKAGMKIEEIFLDHRIERLGHCFSSSPSTGWRRCVVLMLDFLEGRSKSFLEFARDQFSCLAMPLKDCMLTLLTHLPRSLVHEQIFLNIDQLLSLVESMEMLLFENESMTCEELDGIFLQKESTGSEPIADIKSKCVASLRTLQTHLDELDLPMCSNRSSTEEFCFQKASLVFCTISSAYKLHSLDMEPFSILVLDEAARVKEIETIIALQIPYVKHAILFGDDKQLRMTVRSKMCEKIGFGRSLFERMSSLKLSKHLLNVQYKMHPSISRFPNSKFYSNQILDASCVQSQSYARQYLHGKMFGPYSFINIHGGKEEIYDIIGQSSRNMVEVAVMMKLVQKLFKAWNGSNEKLSIGLISPYAAQVAAIQDRLQHKYENLERFTVDVNSVDGFHDGEKDIIIISTVRTHDFESKGSLLSPQSTNFALTRARHSLWILGDEKALSLSDSVWEALICDAKHRQCFFTADEDSDIRKTVVEVKKEMAELESLLHGEIILQQNSRWKVIFSDSFLKSFQKLKSSTVKKLVISMLLKLACGWRRKKVNVDWRCKSTYIVKQFKVDRYFIVCSVDLRKDFERFEQVLKVWDLLPKAETLKLLDRIDSISALYTTDYINHCNEKLLEGNLEVPNSWALPFDIIQFKNHNRAKTRNVADVEFENHVEKSKVSESLLLMKFYSLSTAMSNYLLTDLEGRELDLPFEITSEEREIIIFPRSSFILGRSGTGKTTILTMKLFQKFQHYRVASRDSTVSDNFMQASNNSSGSTLMLRQLFVTVSPPLCYAVKKHLSQLKSFASGNFFGSGNYMDMDDVEDMAKFKDIPDTFVGIQPEKYPLVITFHKFLLMLDGTLANSYFDRLRNVGGKGKGLVDINTFIRNNEVTYDYFWSSYWPRLNAKHTKYLDPSRVFTEIISHIKGSMPKGEACGRMRSRQNYISLSSGRVSTLSAEKRGVIYDVFEKYEKMKMERGEFDIADVVIDIHVRLNKGNLLGDKMDFVYIDEVQDLSMRQINLFKYICNNIEEGFVFSGDTAQTIARGVDFRFEDIRSLFYTEFLRNSGRRDKGVISDNFCLSQNFRTHRGVLRLAQSVIELISHFFPQSIDLLAPETSLVNGESPIVLESGSDENMIITIFGRSGNSGKKWVGFGADQVILVRDDSAKRELSDLIGRQALIMTILQCKGLEFQDVLLYNFFGSSPLSNQWRLLYDFIKEKYLLDGSSPQSFPSFSCSKHNMLCSELKQLYVAITRTRQRLWICENNEEAFKPMLDYWKGSSLVQVRKVDDSLAEEMQSTSTPEEWRSRGIKLFWEKNYEMATICFENAGEETWRKRAKASGLRAAFDSLRGSNLSQARVMLREAAEIFDSINRAESAAECFYDLGEYERAGKIYMKCSMSELRKAGDCFSLAQSYKMAAEAYGKGCFYKECLSACSKGKYFDLGLQYIEDWRNQSSRNSNFDKIALDFLKECPLELFRTKDSASLTKLVQALYTMESKRNFLKSLDRVDVLLNFENMLGNFNEAAEIAECLGDIPRAVDLLAKAEKFEKASLLVLSNVLSNSLWVSGTQGWPLKAFPQKEELLAKALAAAQNVSGTFHACVCAEAEILSHERRTLSELLQCYQSCKEYKAHMGEFLSVRKLLESHFQVGPSDYEWDRELSMNPMLFDEIISSNQVSGGTLLWVWNLWKGQSLEILDCLYSLESVDRSRCDKAIVKFCFSYFGVSLSKDLPSVTYVLLNPNAEWLRNVDERFKVRKGKVVTLGGRHFVSAARNYWCQDFVSVGLRVLEALQGLYKISVAKPLSAYFQSFCLTCIFDVARFFLKSKSLDINKTDARSQKLQDFLQLSTEYFNTVFPLDPRHSLSENMVSLRETELSQTLLEDIISENIKIGHELTYGQIGRVVMIVMGSGKLKVDLHLFYKNPSWMSFMRNFREIKKRDSAKMAQSHQLHQALVETYNANWRGKKDYISPSCFFYLMERLLILVPHSHGSFFTTKSSFIEYLICLPSDADPTASFVADEKSYSSSVFEFVDSMVQHCLFSAWDTAEWISNSKIDCEYYLPVLMLRLVMILCLSSLNSELSFNVILKLLGVPHIRSQLPREFVEALLCKRTNEDIGSLVDVIAGAFQVIGDPLVIVSWNESRPEFVSPDAVFVDLRSFSCRDEIMKILFNPRNNTERNVSEFLEIGVPTTDTIVETNKNRKLHVNWGLIRKVSNSFESLRNRADKYSKSILQKKMEEMEEYLKFLSDVMTQLKEQRYFSGEDKNELSEATCLIEELNRLLSSPERSEYDSKTIDEIGQLLKMLEASEFQLDVLFSQFSMHTGPNGSVVASPAVDYNRNSSFSGQRKKEQLNVTANNHHNQVAGCSLPQGKRKSMNNNNSRKGKKGGRRK